MFSVHFFSPEFPDEFVSMLMVKIFMKGMIQ